MDVLCLDSEPLGFTCSSRDKNWSLSDLKGIWESLFVARVCGKIKSEDKDVQGLLMLLETAVENVRLLGSRFAHLSVSYNSSVKKLHETEDKCNQLKTSLKSIKNAPCEKCVSLKNELKEAKQRADDAETRMNSIAKILRLGDADGSGNNNCNAKSNCDDDIFSSADSVSIVSEILLSKEPVSKRKRSSSLDNKTIKIVNAEDNVCQQKGDDSIQAATLDTPEHGPSTKYLDCDISKQVPETPNTPWKNKKQDSAKNNEKGAEKVIKHLPENSQKLRLRLSNSVNIPPKSNRQSMPPKKNLSADFIDNLEPCEPAKNDVTGINKSVDSDTANNAAEKSNDSLTGCLDSKNTELDKIWFNSNNSQPQPLAEEGYENNTTNRKHAAKGGNKNNSKPVWKLRQNKGPDKCAGFKRLKQTTLGVTQKTAAKDISTMNDFNGGKIESLSCCITSDDEDDIVLPSPKQKKYKKRQEANTFNTTIDLSLFAPIATSTQVTKEGNNTSYDRIPVKEKSTKSPNYKFKRETVRGKEARAKLEGRECEECIKYYKATGQNLSPSKLKERINACSRHKQQELRCKTPPGFWDPLMPSTQECRDRGMYTSIYCLKDTNK